MAFFKDVVETIKSIPFGGFIRSMAKGNLGAPMLFALLLQSFFQFACAAMLGYGLVGAAIIGSLLVAAQLAIIMFVYILLPLSGMSGEPAFKTRKQYAVGSTVTTLVLSGIFGLLFIMLPSVFFPAAAALTAFKWSVVSGTFITGACAILPMYAALGEEPPTSQK